MMRFNCHGKPIIDERFIDAINKWAKAKGVDPEHVFTANDWGDTPEDVINPKGWDIPKYGEYRGTSILRCKPPLSLVVKGKINTCVFEEVEILEYLFNYP